MSEEKKEETAEAAKAAEAQKAETTAETSGETAETAKPSETKTEDGEPSCASSASSASSSAEPEAPAPEAAEPPKAETPKEPDWKTLYALTLADFDNYKKRAARDREDTYRYAEADILKDVLPAVDNLQLALANAKDKADDPFVKGVQMVHDTLLKSLKDHGAEPFDSVGLDLDTERMEAIAHLPHAEIPEGKVSIESKKGWMLKDKVLRAAQVVVSSGKPA